MTKTPKTEAEPQPCQCRAVFAYNVTKGDTPESLEPGDNPDEIVAVVHQACGEQTQRTFAPGHDAKLKGVLLRAARSGREYAYVEGGLLIYADPMIELTNRGWAHLLVELKERPKKVRKPKAAKTVEAPAGFHPVRVKLGRWEYDGQIVSTNDVGQHVVEYTNAKGETKQATVTAAQIVG